MNTILPHYYMQQPQKIEEVPNPSKLQVKEFHEAFGHPINGDWTPELLKLRCRLILEEALELCDACGLDVIAYQLNGKNHIALQEYEFMSVSPVGVADALGDLDYVVQGANVALGIPSEAVFAEIHRSNMSKLGADGKPIYREDGKVLKGPNYTPPNLGPIVEPEMYNREGEINV